MLKVAFEHHPLSAEHQETVAGALQASLTDLIDLALQLKQAHWNLVGPNFRALHLQLDEIIDDVRAASDDVAERIMAIGVSADGRVATVASETDLPTFPEGKVHCGEAVELVGERLSQVASRVRSRFQMLDDADLVSQDMLIGITQKLEKHLWMIQAQTREI